MLLSANSCCCYIAFHALYRALHQWRSQEFMMEGLGLILMYLVILNVTHYMKMYHKSGFELLCHAKPAKKTQ